MRGEVDVRSANVRVDRVPLDVGPNCHTAAADEARPGRDRAAYNLFTGGPLSGPLTIPPFTGCGSNGDDLDPLLDGTIAGPGNRLALHQGNLAPFEHASSPTTAAAATRPSASHA